MGSIHLVLSDLNNTGGLLLMPSKYDSTAKYSVEKTTTWIDDVYKNNHNVPFRDAIQKVMNCLY